MRNLLRFLLKYHLVILFLILESLALVIFIQRNGFQRSRFLNFTDALTGSYEEKVGNLRSYFRLHEINQQLSTENIRLKNELQLAYQSDEIFFYSVEDSVRGQRYYYTPARVINNSINKQRNFLTLDKGSLDGIKPEDGVICSQGLVGVVYRVSPHYSIVLSLLNLDFRVSAKLKKNDYYGSLFWEGTDYQTATLTEIPHHVDVSQGDTIITSGYSAIFPEGVLIGLVDQVNRKGGDFLEIRVALATDFKNLSYVQVVANLRKEEREQIEKNMSSD